MGLSGSLPTWQPGPSAIPGRTEQFYWQRLRRVYEIISIDRYKQAAAALDSSPVGSHISEASFETSLEAIKRRAHTHTHTLKESPLSPVVL